MTAQYAWCPGIQLEYAAAESDGTARAAAVIGHMSNQNAWHAERAPQ